MARASVQAASAESAVTVDLIFFAFLPAMARSARIFTFFFFFLSVILSVMASRFFSAFAFCSLCFSLSLSAAPRCAPAYSDMKFGHTLAAMSVRCAIEVVQRLSSAFHSHPLFFPIASQAVLSFFELPALHTCSSCSSWSNIIPSTASTPAAVRATSGLTSQELVSPSLTISQSAAAVQSPSTLMAAHLSAFDLAPARTFLYASSRTASEPAVFGTHLLSAHLQLSLTSHLSLDLDLSMSLHTKRSRVALHAAEASFFWYLSLSNPSAAGRAVFSPFLYTGPPPSQSLWPLPAMYFLPILWEPGHPRERPMSAALTSAFASSNMRLNLSPVLKVKQ